jgi:hypothetical protein
MKEIDYTTKRASQDLRVKVFGLLQIEDRKCQVKGLHFGDGLCRERSPAEDRESQLRETHGGFHGNSQVKSDKRKMPDSSLENGDAVVWEEAEILQEIHQILRESKAHRRLHRTYFQAYKDKFHPQSTTLKDFLLDFGGPPGLHAAATGGPGQHAVGSHQGPAGTAKKTLTQKLAALATSEMGSLTLPMPQSIKQDTPTLRNLQSLILVCLENHYLNHDGSPLPLSPENLTKYIDYQISRMEAGQISLSSLNWYLQSLRKYYMESGLDWESLRQTEAVKMAMGRARKIATTVSSTIQQKKKAALAQQQATGTSAVVSGSVTQEKKRGRKPSAGVSVAQSASSSPAPKDNFVPPSHPDDLLIDED